MHEFLLLLLLLLTTYKSDTFIMNILDRKIKYK